MQVHEEVKNANHCLFQNAVGSVVEIDLKKYRNTEIPFHTVLKHVKKT